MWTNYHCHSHFCSGSGEPEAYIQSALEKGVQAIGFSTNAPWPLKKNVLKKSGLLQDYTKEVERLKLKYWEQMEVYKGMKVDFIPGVMGPDHRSIRAMNLDYTIGAVRYIESLNDGTPWCIGGTTEEFAQRVNEAFGGNPRKAIERYFQMISWMVMLDAPDVVAHLDLIKKHNKEQPFFSPSDSWYHDAVYAALKTISASDCIVEVNTRGLFSGETMELYPSRWMLECIRELKNPITLSAEAWNPEELAAGLSPTAQLLRDMGFRKVSVLWDGGWQRVDFSAEGFDLPPRTWFRSRASRSS